MEATLGILVFIVAVLAVLQGWQLVSNRRRRNNNPTNERLDSIAEKLDAISEKLGRTEMRLNDIWDKVNR